jgi:hypothetical protein
MKRIALTVISLLLALSFTLAQKGNQVKSVDITARTIESPSADKPLVIDLTHNGSIYKLAAGIDYRRVQVRTASGDIAMNRLTDRFRTDRAVVLGNAKAVRAQVEAAR